MTDLHIYSQITMWDLANGKLLRTITDAHPPGTAILHVKVRLTRLSILLFRYAKPFIFGVLPLYIRES